MMFMSTASFPTQIPPVHTSPNTYSFHFLSVLRVSSIQSKTLQKASTSFHASFQTKSHMALPSMLDVRAFHGQSFPRKLQSIWIVGTPMSSCSKSVFCNVLSSFDFDLTQILHQLWNGRCVTACLSCSASSGRGSAGFWTDNEDQ